MTTHYIPFLRLSGPNAIFVKRVEDGGRVLHKQGLIFMKSVLFAKFPPGTPILIHKNHDLNEWEIHESFSHLAPEGFEWEDGKSLIDP